MGRAGWPTGSATWFGFCLALGASACGASNQLGGGDASAGGGGDAPAGGGGDAPSEGDARDVGGSLGDGAGPEGDGGIPLAAFVKAVVDDGCERAVRCGTSPDLATCQSTSFPDYAQMIADVGLGVVIYDGRAAAACLAATAQRGCRLSERFGSPTPQPCLDMFTGTLPTGASCFANRECLSGFCKGDLVGNACNTGACEATIAVAPGGDCGATGSVCGDGTVCVKSAGAAVCSSQRAAVGASCSDGSLCVAGSLCVTGSTPVPTCLAIPDEGARCDGPLQFCDLVSDVCDATSKTCVPRRKPPGPCRSNEECVTYAYCDATTGLCVARYDAGTSCTGNQCVGALVCAGVCVRPTAPAACLRQ